MTVNTAPIAENLCKVRSAIVSAATQCARDPNNIQLLAVSKTKPVSDILQAYENGQRAFGENYVQEGTEKIQQLRQYSDIVWHYIGPLQSNKSKFIAEHFDWIQSVDRIKIAKRLNEQRSVYQSPLNLCVQVNIDNETNKAGVEPEQVFDFVRQVSEFGKLRCRGLMAIPKASNDKAQQAASFKKMQQLFNQCHKSFPDFDTLSMGMSADMQVAIEYGSTMVRVGTGIFGSRN